MSSIPAVQDWISPENYLESELTSEIRHEYLAGQVYAMSGASVEHNRIVADIFLALGNHLRGKRCEAFINDMKARIVLKGEDWFYYPDILVNWDPSGQKKYYCESPSVVIEVLSPSTQRTDEHEKFIVYQAIPSLQSYVLVSQERWQVRVYRRSQNWLRESFTRDEDALHLPELEFVLPLREIYGRIPGIAKGDET